MKSMDLLLAFYGDDFTGSTDAMEALTLKGYRTVLFLEPPSDEDLQSFPDLQCIGVAGTSRAKDYNGIIEELSPVMASLSKSGARIVHYKVCSTFDSSEEIGSIGKAIETSIPYFVNQQNTPVLVGATALGRYTLFGNHFARSGEKVYRLDRHPIMSKHPMTPMDEADLALHLKKQIDSEIGNLTVLDLANEDFKAIYERLVKQYDIVIHDVYDEELLRRSGELIWNQSQDDPLFVVGSSGIEYALTDFWTTDPATSPKGSTINEAEPVEHLLVISGSASAITKQQIDDAVSRGFVPYRVPVELLTRPDSILPLEYLSEPLRDLQDGKSVILFTAHGPDDPSIIATRNYFAGNGFNHSRVSEVIGQKLGVWTKYLMKESGLNRIVVAGGDTSGFVTKELGVYALEILKSISPGAPLCIGYTNRANKSDSIEIALKGGQFGGESFFSDVKNANNISVG